MYHTFLKSSNLALFRTVFRFEKNQLEVFFFNFSKFKNKEEICKIIDIQRKVLTRFLRSMK